MKRISWSAKLILIFGLIIIASIVAIIFILKKYKPTSDTIPFEIVKSLLQILTVLVLGQVVSLVVAKFNLNRQKEEAKTEFQRDIHRRLIRAYIAILKHRRLLRAKGLLPAYIGKIQENTVVRLDSYDRQMQFINETEVKLKAIRHEISPATFTEPQLLAKYVERMEDYLRNLITLYEQKLGAFTGTPSILPLADLNLLPESKFTLGDFVGKTRGSQFDAEFVEPYHNASKAMIEDILK